MGGGHCGRERAHGQDLEEFADVVAIALVVGGFQGGENTGRELLFESCLYVA